MEPLMRSGDAVASFQQQGFTYIGLLITVTIMGSLLASVTEVYHTTQQRERERELLFVGDEIRRAIGRYYMANTGSTRQYPQQLEDLLKDPRQPGTIRHLRKLYRDPITGTSEWGTIRDSNGRIMGVFSLSEARPIKQTNFRRPYREFEGKERYSEWTFIYQPRHSRVEKAREP